MTDDEFIDGALCELPDRIKAAATACRAAQSVRGGRLTPREVKDTCRALGLAHYEEQTPVLALLGWVYSSETRRNRHVFWDLFTRSVNIKHLMPLPEKNMAMALAISRIAIKTVDPGTVKISQPLG